MEAFRERVPVMLCSESGGEGRNLQFANTLINFDLPWNPMRIEQRVGRIHRIGQTREVFIFNLCTAGSLEARILDLLDEKIRMFELVVGEVGSILGNLEGGEEFESLVLNLWLRSHDDGELRPVVRRAGPVAAGRPGGIPAHEAARRGAVRRGLPMSGGVQGATPRLRHDVLERRGGLVDWPAADRAGAAMVPPEVAAAVGRRRRHRPAHLRSGRRRAGPSVWPPIFSNRPAGCWTPSRAIGTFRVRELYLKRKELDEGIRRAFTWLNAKVKLREARDHAWSTTPGGFAPR